MVIIDQITEREAKLLKDYNIVIDEHDYNSDELEDILDVLRDAEVFNLPDDGKTYSSLCEAYARLHDKFFDFGEEQYKIENSD